MTGSIRASVGALWLGGGVVVDKPVEGGDEGGRDDLRPHVVVDGTSTKAGRRQNPRSPHVRAGTGSSAVLGYHRRRHMAARSMPNTGW